MGLLKSLGKGIAKGLDVLTATYAKPVAVASAVLSPKKTVQEVVNETFSQPKSKTVKQIVTNTVIGAGAVVAAPYAAASPVVATIAKTVAKSPTVAKVAGVTGAVALTAPQLVTPTNLKTTAAFAINPVAATVGTVVTAVDKSAEFYKNPNVPVGEKVAAAALTVVGGAALVGAVGAATGLFDGKKPAIDPLVIPPESGTYIPTNPITSDATMPAALPATSAMPAQKISSSTKKKKKKKSSSKTISVKKGKGIKRSFGSSDNDVVNITVNT